MNVAELEKLFAPLRGFELNQSVWNTDVLYKVGDVFVYHEDKSLANYPFTVIRNLPSLELHIENPDFSNRKYPLSVELGSKRKIKFLKFGDL